MIMEADGSRQSEQQRKTWEESVNKDINNLACPTVTQRFGSDGEKKSTMVSNKSRFTGKIATMS